MSFIEDHAPGKYYRKLKHIEKENNNNSNNNNNNNNNSTGGIKTARGNAAQ